MEVHLATMGPRFGQLRQWTRCRPHDQLVVPVLNSQPAFVYYKRGWCGGAAEARWAGC
jgi:hypothetical protein